MDEKDSLRKRSKSFLVKNGLLYYQKKNVDLLHWTETNIYNYFSKKTLAYTPFVVMTLFGIKCQV